MWYSLVKRSAYCRTQWGSVSSHALTACRLFLLLIYWRESKAFWFFFYGIGALLVFRLQNMCFDRYFHKYWAQSPSVGGSYGKVSLILWTAERTVPVEYCSPTATYERMIRVFVLLLLSTTSSRCLEAGYNCCVGDASFIRIDARTPCVTDVSTAVCDIIVHSMLVTGARVRRICCWCSHLQSTKIMISAR